MGSACVCYVGVCGKTGKSVKTKRGMGKREGEGEWDEIAQLICVGSRSHRVEQDLCGRKSVPNSDPGACKIQTQVPAAAKYRVILFNSVKTQCEVLETNRRKMGT